MLAYGRQAKHVRLGLISPLSDVLCLVPKTLEGGGGAAMRRRYPTLIEIVQPSTSGLLRLLLHVYGRPVVGEQQGSPVSIPVCKPCHMPAHPHLPTRNLSGPFQGDRRMTSRISKGPAASPEQIAPSTLPRLLDSFTHEISQACQSHYAQFSKISALAEAIERGTALPRERDALFAFLIESVIRFEMNARADVDAFRRTAAQRLHHDDAWRRYAREQGRSGLCVGRGLQRVARAKRLRGGADRRQHFEAT
jgi:hypothetical protein